jgi:hypothetical protein
MYKISYSAPVCITLAGDDTLDIPRFDEPFLMCAQDERVMVTVQDSGKAPDKILDTLVELMPLAKPRPYLHVEGRGNFSLRGVQAAHIVAATACYLEYVHAKPPTQDQVQKSAYTLEKKLFMQRSHAQTTTSTQGGLIFYRKEFDFYKSVVSIPAKFPQSFEQWLATGPAGKPSHAQDSAHYIRQLVFAIKTENLTLFQSIWDGTIGDLDLYMNPLMPTHVGLLRE